jgi:multidrug efflux system outer membrane protein
MVASGCHVGKKYADPKPDLPVTYRGASASEDTATVGKMPLHQFFTDTTLQRLIDSTIHRNFDLQYAIKNMEAASLLMKQAKLGYWPDINAQLSANTLRPSDNSASGAQGITHIEDYNASIGISWELDIWGKIRMKKAAALASYLASDEARKAIQTELVAEVASGYYNLLALDAQVEIARKNLTLRDSTLRIIRLQYDAGQVTSLAVKQADAQKQFAALLLPGLEQDIAIQENALRLLAGELPSAILRYQHISDLHIPDVYSAGVPAEMVGFRPDVRARELSLQAADQRVGIAHANMYPSLVITAGGGLNSFLLSNWFNIPASLFGLVGGSLTQPIFRRGQLKTEYELAKVEREKSVILFRQSVLVAVNEVSNALVRVEKLRSEVQISSARADTLANVTANAALLFRNGMANYLEVITAQAAALQSQLDVADFKRLELSAYVELYRSLGGGWR